MASSKIITQYNVSLEPAAETDLDEIYTLYQKAIAHMAAHGMHFWDFSVYPSASVLSADVQKKHLYVVHDPDTGKIAACIVLNEEYDEQYAQAQWNYPTSNPLIIHRLCIHPDFQGNGLGKAVMHAAEHWAVSHHFEIIRLDAFSGNIPSLTLYSHLGYTKTGEAHWIKGTFWLMEKNVRQNP
jgi:RimJ/RimL family protein N-acetyltransferase